VAAKKPAFPSAGLGKIKKIPSKSKDRVNYNIFILNITLVFVCARQSLYLAYKLT
jgi:hypothetical protein